MASLDILCSNPFNLENKITVIEHKKIFCGHQHMPKIFHDPHKNPPAPRPIYLMYGPLISYSLIVESQDLVLKVIYSS